MESDLRQLAPADYPESLREIPDVPDALFVRGALPPPHHKVLTVVGSRDLSAYGKQAAEYLIQGLAGYPITILSGLAFGADACAHRAALAAGLHTVAMPGSGISDNAIAPRSHALLAHDILAAGGALISEYTPDTKAAPWMFPARNRLMVGMAHAVLVIEAGERSGTLITARLAGEYNRDLLCVPYRIGDRGGYGANLFIRLGAGLVSEPAHILDALGIASTSPAVVSAPTSLSPHEQQVYDALVAPTTRDELIRSSTLSASDILAALVMLELQGIVKEEFGMWRRV